jgi:uncharacterized protein
MLGMDPRLSVAGLVVGICVGLSGVGGSAILAPMLILVLGVKPSLVIGTDLLYSVPTKILALVLHLRQGTVDWAITRALLLGGIPGAVGGLVVFAYLKAHVPIDVLEADLKHGIGVAILVASAGSAAMWLVQAKRNPATHVAPTYRPLLVMTIGVVVGVLVSITSIGSGSITLPLLALTLSAIALRRLIGSEIAFAAFLVPVAAIGQGTLGNVSWPMAIALLIGALPGVWIGSKLVAALGDAWLRPAIVAVLAFAGSRLV